MTPKKHTPLFFLLFFILIPPVTAIADDNSTLSNIFDILNYSIWTGDWSDLEANHKPCKDLHHQDHLHAWLDITGFEREIKYKGEIYVYGDPLPININKTESLTRYPTHTHNPHKNTYGAVIIESDTYHNKWQTHTKNSWHNTKTQVTEFNQVLNVTDNETYITATLSIHLVWWYFCTLPGNSHSDRYDEYLKLTDTIKKPKQYPYTIWNVTGSVVQHYSNLTPYTTVEIPQQESVMFTNITYNGSTALRVDSLGIVVNDSRYMRVNFIPNSTYWIIDPNQSVIGAGDKKAVVYDVPLNMSLLNVSISSPFETRYVTDFTVEEIHENPRKVIHPFLIALFAPLFVLMWIIYRSWKIALGAI